VRAALEAGSLDAARYANYRKLGGEVAAAAQGLAAQQARRADVRVADKAYKKRLDDKYGRH
jgi:ribosome biogenesis GTPase